MFEWLLRPSLLVSATRIPYTPNGECRAEEDAREICRQADRAFRRWRVGPAFSRFSHQAYKRLAILRNAPHLRALAAIKSNRLEALHGDPEGQDSIRINDQWRICFGWDEHEHAALNIEIVDDH